MGLENHAAVTGSDGHSFALAAGYDQRLTEALTLGAAISFGGSVFEGRSANAEAYETSFGLTPYIAYQIDDRFTLQGLVGYDSASGNVDIGGIDGDYQADRFFAAVDASAFENWGDFSVFASVGVFWGQACQHSYLDESDTYADGVRTQLGSLSATAQPAYLIMVDEGDGFFVEPFLLGRYDYDFSITKVRGEANDRDAFLVGAGANLFYGDSLSGTVEASQTLGREDKGATTARATVRVDF